LQCIVIPDAIVLPPLSLSLSLSLSLFTPQVGFNRDGTLVASGAMDGIIIVRNTADASVSAQLATARVPSQRTAAASPALSLRADPPYFSTFLDLPHFER